jgi:hypothetical protein
MGDCLDLWSEDRTTSEMICKRSSFGRVSRAEVEETFVLVGMLDRMNGKTREIAVS